MLDIPEEVKELFKQDGIKKYAKITVITRNDMIIDNEKLISESIKLTDSVCSTQFKFGKTEKKQFEFEAHGIPNLKNDVIKYEIGIDTSSIDYEINPYYILQGLFNVDQCTEDQNTKISKVVAYTPDENALIDNSDIIQITKEIYSSIRYTSPKELTFTNADIQGYFGLSTIDDPEVIETYYGNIQELSYGSSAVEIHYSTAESSRFTVYYALIEKDWDDKVEAICDIINSTGDKRLIDFIKEHNNVIRISYKDKTEYKKLKPGYGPVRSGYIHNDELIDSDITSTPRILSYIKYRYKDSLGDIKEIIIRKNTKYDFHYYSQMLLRPFLKLYSKENKDDSGTYYNYDFPDIDLESYLELLGGYGSSSIKNIGMLKMTSFKFKNIQTACPSSGKFPGVYLHPINDIDAKYDNVIEFEKSSSELNFKFIKYKDFYIDAVTEQIIKKYDTDEKYTYVLDNNKILNSYENISFDAIKNILKSYFFTRINFISSNVSNNTPNIKAMSIIGLEAGDSVGVGDYICFIFRKTTSGIQTLFDDIEGV